ncbi:tyrosine-type recombinase/integrase [Nocardia asiatica]|uniref:tyrosine-type recombinase/integrase n=1 Tax=Nocardia asiatica TaxID=209252 RepID=UPI000315727F|nr:site-specific integrase [Nocardia asiatica]
MAKKTARRSWGTCKKLPSGRYRASYVGPDAITYAHPGGTFSAKVDAEGWLAQERRKIDLGTWRPPTVEAQSGQTLKDYAADWLAHRDLKPRTRGLYEDLLRLHINPALGDRELGSIRPADVRRWYGQLQSGKTRRAHAYALLHAIYSTAVADEVLEANPCRIKAAMRTKRRRTINVMTPADLVDLVTELPEHLRLAVLVTAWCGLRPGELKELRRKDFRSRGRAIRVERAVSYRAGRRWVDTPKAESCRTVTIPPHLVPLVREHLSRNVGPNVDALVFPNEEGEYLKDWTLRNWLNRASERTGKPRVTPYTLRHCAGTWTAQSGATLRELMDRLGHVTQNAALLYQHTAAGRDIEIARRLSELHNGG